MRSYVASADPNTAVIARNSICRAYDDRAQHPTPRGPHNSIYWSAADTSRESNGCDADTSPVTRQPTHLRQRVEDVEQRLLLELGQVARVQARRRMAVAGRHLKHRVGARGHIRQRRHEGLVQRVGRVEVEAWVGRVARGWPVSDLLDRMPRSGGCVM